MARKPDPQKDAAMKDIIASLRLGADLEVIHVKYHKVKQPTWYRWINEAKAHIAAEKLANPKREKNKNNSVKSVAPEAPKKGRGRPKGSTKPPALEGELLPHDEPDAPRSKRGGGGDAGGLSEDGLTYIVNTMFGPKETSVIQRFTEKPEMDPNLALGLLDKMAEKFFDAEALMKASMKAVDGGHVVLDSQAFHGAVDLQRKIIMDQLKILKESRNLDQLDKFVQAIVANVRRESPEIALKVIKAIREATSPFSRQSWQQTAS